MKHMAWVSKPPAVASAAPEVKLAVLNQYFAAVQALVQSKDNSTSENS